MTALPDPLRFSALTLERLGALVDVEGDRATAVLPAPLAARLGLPEGVEIGSGANGTYACGLGSPLLEALVEDGRAVVPLASASADLLPPRESAVRSLADAYCVRNGIASVQEISTGPAWYVVAAIAWTVEADERYEGLVVGAIDPCDGGRPTVDFHVDSDLRQKERCSPPQLDSKTAARWVGRMASSLVEPAIEMPLANAARRQTREHDRIHEYYRQLIIEAQRPKRRVDQDAIAAKVHHLVSERDTRLADLGHRYTARVTVRPAGALHILVTAGFATLLVRRRKGERRLRLRVPPSARAFDRLPCDGCAGWADAGIALCDERLHVLCARCVPEASGRPRCPACTG